MHKRPASLIQLALIIILCTLLLSACSRERNAETIRIAEQYGLAYAPVQLIRIEEELEKSGYRVEWVRLMNTAAIREAMLAGRADIGFMGIPPFLIGREQGMDWRIFTGLCRAPLGLVSLRDDLRSLNDFGPGDRIALPQPGSIQHILLSMAAERYLGDPFYFDDRLVTLSHPDGFNAIRSGGDVSAHFTSPPYLFEELKLPGARLIVGGDEAFGGPFTFIVGAVRKEFADAHPELLDRVKSAVEEKAAMLNTSPEESAALLAEEYKIEADLLKEYLGSESLVYSSEVIGLNRFQEFMFTTGLLESPYSRPGELLISLDDGRDP